MWLQIVLLLCFLVLCIYWRLSLNYNYWKSKNVPTPPVSVLFGNVGAVLSLSKPIGQIYCDIYNNYQNLRYVGFYQVSRPGIVLRDPDLIKDVLIEYSSYFLDNDVCPDEKYEPIGSKNPFVLKRSHLKIVRTQPSPSFTSKRLKAMFPLLDDSVQKLMSYLDQHQTAMETTELSGKYITEVIASCIFGLEAKSFTDDNSEFRKMEAKIFEPTVINSIKFLLCFMFPSFANILRIKFIPDEVLNYFKDTINQTLKYRTENNIITHDFLGLMLEFKKTRVNYPFTDDDVLARCLGFIVDGYGTSASALSYTLNELAANPDVQEKLRKEIGSTKLTYDVIHSIPYLDAVLNESLRLHPPGMFLSRRCTTECYLPLPSTSGTSSDVIIKVGTLIIVPVYALHYDKQYFDEPERFYPDRFMETENIKSKCTFLPFGDGRRSCTGQRFAVNQIKVAVANIVQNFEIRVNSATKVPLETDPKGGIWLEFKRRN